MALVSCNLTDVYRSVTRRWGGNAMVAYMLFQSGLYIFHVVLRLVTIISVKLEMYKSREELCSEMWRNSS